MEFYLRPDHRSRVDHSWIAQRNYDHDDDHHPCIGGAVTRS